MTLVGHLHKAIYFPISFLVFFVISLANVPSILSNELLSKDILKRGLQHTMLFTIGPYKQCGVTADLVLQRIGSSGAILVSRN